MSCFESSKMCFISLAKQPENFDNYLIIINNVHRNYHSDYVDINFTTQCVDCSYVFMSKFLIFFFSFSVTSLIIFSTIFIS